MLRMFNIRGATLRDQPVDEDNLKAALDDAVWIDAHEPTEEERGLLNTFRGIALTMWRRSSSPRVIFRTVPVCTFTPCFSRRVRGGTAP